MNDLANINDGIALLDTNPASLENMLELRQSLEFFMGKAKEAKTKLDEAMIAWIQANGDIELGGGQRWYVGIDKTTKVKDLPRTLERLLQATGGDWERFAEQLASNPVKHGSARKLFEEAGMPDAWAQSFEVIEKPSLEEGKVKVKLVKHDDRFSGK